LLEIGFHIKLRGHWWYVIVVIVHAPTEDKNVENDCFYGTGMHV
jgi:hypothetical protein